MSSSEQQRLQNEITELRGELGETVEALVHKVDVPARAKERGSELAEQAVERGIELHQQAVDRGSDLSERLIEWCAQFQGRQMPVDRWVKFAGAGLAALALMIIIQKRHHS